MDEEVNFIIVYQGRAGSSFLVRALDQHPDVTAKGEFFNWVGRLRIVPKKNPTISKRLLDMAVRFVTREPEKRQLRAIEALYDDPLRATRVIGFKTKLGMIGDLAGLKALLEDRQIRTLVLSRKNFVKKAVANVYSERLFERTKDKYGYNAWNLFDEEDRLGPQYIDPEGFEYKLSRAVLLHERLQAFAEGLVAPKLLLEYSDLLLDEEKWFRASFDFLSVEPRRLESPVLRNEPVDLRDAVTNLEELRTIYRGTAFDPMFDEVL